MTPFHEDAYKTTTLHLAYSFACNLSCGHCIFRCGPNDDRTMGVERARTFIEQAGEAGVRRIVFTGGEPFLHPHELRELIRHTAGQGMKSALVTNAAWASSRVEAKAYLASLKKTTLESITLSTDRYHLLEVPLENLRNALEASRDMGLQTAVKISRLPQDSVAEGLYRALRTDFANIFIQDISPVGRAAALRSAVRLKPAVSFTGPGCFTPPILLPDGHLLICCNLPAQDTKPTDYPFVLGTVESEPLASLLDRRSRDPLLAALRSRGPGPLLALLSGRDPALKNADKAPYHSACELCFHLFCRLQNKRLLYEILGDRTRDEYTSPGASL